MLTIDEAGFYNQRFYISHPFSHKQPQVAYLIETYSIGPINLKSKILQRCF